MPYSISILTKPGSELWTFPPAVHSRARHPFTRIHPLVSEKSAFPKGSKSLYCNEFWHTENIIIFSGPHYLAFASNCFHSALHSVARRNWPPQIKKLSDTTFGRVSCRILIVPAVLFAKWNAVAFATEFSDQLCEQPSRRSACWQ